MTAEIEKALRHRVVMVAGDEEALRRRALRDLLEGMGMTKDDFDLETFDPSSSDPMQWVASVGTSPFLAPRRVAIVRHLLQCEADRLKGVELKNLPESSLLILVADDEGGSEDRVQRMKTTVRRGWEKAVTAGGGLVMAFDPDPKRAKEAIKREAAATGKKMSDRGLDALVEMTGGSLSRAVDEMEKLVLYVGDAEQIRESDVHAVVVASREWNVFRMVDAIVSNDVGEALRQLRVLVSNNTKAEDAAYRQILPQVSRQLRLIWQGRLCVDARCSPADAPASVRSMFPEKPNLAKEQPYRQSAVMAAARRISLKRLARCLAVLADTDARLKGSLDAYTPLETLERMILEMAAVLSAK